MSARLVSLESVAWVQWPRGDGGRRHPRKAPMARPHIVQFDRTQALTDQGYTVCGSRLQPGAALTGHDTYGVPPAGACLRCARWLDEHTA